MFLVAGQIGHRDQDALLKSSDSDFPEPGQNEEHTGEPQARNQLNRDTEIACEDRKACASGQIGTAITQARRLPRGWAGY